MADFILDTLRGGLDDFSAVSELAKDACTVAENVEFFYSTLGERRAGCEAIVLAAGISGDALLAAATWMFYHLPTDDERDGELWVMTVDSDLTAKMYRLTVAGWTAIPFPVGDEPTFADVLGYRMYGQSLHGKLFIAYHSAVDRLYVWDGTNLRRVGLAASGAPTVANTGGGAYAATLRYYRTRSIAKSGAVVLRRSEPSGSTSFTPSGAGTAARVTRAAAVSEGETHWEVEVSLDGAAFYRLAQVVIGTTTYDDSAVTTTYSANVLSEEIGTYTLIPSVRYLSSDGDRLLLAGSWHVPADASAVRWTPVGNDPSPGPDERLNANTDPRVDLDANEGGDISGLSRADYGSVLAFKREGVYKLVRTGQLVGAYEVIPITKTRGAYPRSIVDANDEAGQSARYFLDPTIGPMRAGINGLQFCGQSVNSVWRRVNRAAIVPCHGVFYSDKQQLHYWIAVDGASYPNMKIVLQTNEVRIDESRSAMRGWSTVPAPARIADARCSVMCSRDIQLGDLPKVPFIGKAVWTVAAATIKDVVQQCDVGITDAHTSGDTASGYLGKVRTRPFFLTNILNRHGIQAAALLGEAGSRVLLTGVRDFGTETRSVSADMTAVGSETYVIAQLDDFLFAELYAIQFQAEDDPAHPSQWRLLQLALKPEAEQTS